MMRRTFLFFAALLTVLVGGLSAADAVPSRQFNRHGVVFTHPADWKVSVEETEGGPVIILEEPGDAVAMVTVFKEGLDVSLEDYMNTFMESMTADLPPNASLKRTGQSVGPGKIDVKFVLTFQGLDLPTTANLTKHTLGGRSVYCVTQVIDEDRAKVQAGFDQIRRSLAPATEPVIR